MSRPLHLLLLLPLFTACTANEPSGVTIDPSKNPTTTTMPSVTLPALGNGAMPMLQSGQITLTADTAPGTATFTGAKAWAEDRDTPPAYGSGSFAVTVAGTAHTSTAAQTIFAVENDGTGGEYLLLGALDEDPGAGTAKVMYVVVKKSDFAPGAEVALDGIDRYALFAAGSTAEERPETVAVAVSGTVRFGASADLATAIDASLDATFARADWEEESDPDGGIDGGTDGGPRTNPDPLAPLAAGPHQLVYGAAYDVYCDGTLAGHEADFEAIGPAALGFADAAVIVGGDATHATVTGVGLAAAYGSDALSLDPDSDNQAWVGYFDLGAGAAGPLATSRRMSFLAVRADAGAAGSGAAGVMYLTADEASACQLTYAVSLQP